MALDIHIEEKVLNCLQSIVDKFGQLLIFSSDSSVETLFRQVFNQCRNSIMSSTGEGNLFEYSTVIRFTEARNFEKKIESCIREGVPVIAVVDYKMYNERNLYLIDKLSKVKDIILIVLAGRSESSEYVNIWEHGGKNIIVKGTHNIESLSSKVADIIDPVNVAEKGVRYLESLIETRNLEKALEIGKLIITKFPIPMSYLAMGIVHEERGELIEAMKFYKIATIPSKSQSEDNIDDNRPNVAAMIRLYNLLLQMGYLKQAIELLKQLDQINPDNAKRKFELVKVLSQLLESKKSESIPLEKIAEIKKQIVHFADEAMVLTKKYMSENLDTLKSELSQHVNLRELPNSFRRDPNQHRVIEKIDDINFLIDKATTIQNQINEREKLNRENKIDFSSQDLTWINQKTSELQRCYTRAVQLDPENPKLYYLQGEIFFKANKLKDSISFFETGIKLDPEYPRKNPEIAITLCKVFRADGERSKMFYEIAQRAFPESSQVLELGKLLKL